VYRKHMTINRIANPTATIRKSVRNRTTDLLGRVLFGSPIAGALGASKIADPV
jgi:hypothetical protein